MKRVVVLKDHRVVEIRPIAADDVERSAAFFKALGEEERKYLRRDVTQRPVIEERINEALTNKVDRIVALYQDRIVADGSLEPERFQWAEGVAQIRIIVAPDFRRVGLGLRVVRELYVLAHQRDMARVLARFMAPQAAARAIFHKLGFQDEFVIPKHVRDLTGAWQDLIIMRCDLAVLADSDSMQASARR
jgi:L-amino acid N-acyltransferase YncA